MTNAETHVDGPMQPSTGVSLHIQQPEVYSNSELDTYLQCRRSHYYKFILGLTPKNMSRALHIGLLGHAVLERYYELLRDKQPIKDAFAAGMQLITESYDYEDVDVVSIISNRFSRYVKYWDDSEWRIVDVEQKYFIPMNERITLGMTIDLLVEYVKGPYRGQMAVIDHKYKYNFPSPDELSMNVQLYKYIWGLQADGYPVRHAIMNCLRYREDLKDEDKMFKRFPMKPKGMQLENIMVEHLNVAEEVHQAKREPVAEYVKRAHRRGNPRDCAGCYFRIPCLQSLQGLDEARTLATMYTPDGRQGPYKPYGY